MDFYRSTLFIACLSCLVISSRAQYDTAENICGGWFKSQPGIIQFNFSEPSGTNLKCVWTINPANPSGYSAYSTSISRTSGVNCNTADTVTVSHFELGSERVSSSYTWKCGTPITRPAVPGTVIVVVFVTNSITAGTGFTFTYERTGTMIPSRLRNVNYNWGKESSYPNYYASGFYRNEIVTHTFARGNGTSNTYNMVVTFTRLKFDCQDPDPANLDACRTSTDASLLSKMIIFGINESGALDLQQVVKGEGGLTEQVANKRFSGKNGIFIIVWGGDYNYAGGSMQLNYETSL